MTLHTMFKNFDTRLDNYLNLSNTGDESPFEKYAIRQLTVWPEWNSWETFQMKEMIIDVDRYTYKDSRKGDQTYSEVDWN